jgi:predicted kinase
VAAHGGDDALGQAYFTAAQGYLHPIDARLFAIGGLSGSGKTTLARALAPHIDGAPGAVILRSDEIRKRLWSAAPLDRLPAAAYTAEASDAVHIEMFKRADMLLEAGRSVVLDATFLEKARRDEAQAVAEAAGVAFQGVWLEGNPTQLGKRLASRRGDASDADETVLRAQEALDPGEIVWTRLAAEGDLEALATRIAARKIEGERPCTD